MGTDERKRDFSRRGILRALRKVIPKPSTVLMRLVAVIIIGSNRRTPCRKGEHTGLGLVEGLFCYKSMNDRLKTLRGHGRMV
jgi:hypothetical protein